MEILLFGITRDIVGSASISMRDMDSDRLNTVGELKTYLKNTYPELNKLSSLAIAVNKSYAAEEDMINTFDEIALIPPVSGG